VEAQDRQAEAAPAEVPGRLLCVGDIHGCVDELERLLDLVAPGEQDRLVFLGDYIDRGPASASVVEVLLEVEKHLPGTVFLRGNHEDMLLDFLGLDGSHGDSFLWNGGDRTVASYGIDVARGPVLPGRVAAALPPEHLRFFRSALHLWYRAGRFTFVHAGVRPGRPIAEQDRSDLLWIRDEFLRHDHGLPTTIVFGHTPQREVLLDVPRKIGLDTGAVYGGKLSCLDLTNFVLHQVERRSRRTERKVLRVADAF